MYINKFSGWLTRYTVSFLGECSNVISMKLQLSKSTDRAINPPEVQIPRSRFEFGWPKGKMQRYLKTQRKLVRHESENTRITAGEIVEEQRNSAVNVSRHTMGRGLKRDGMKARHQRKTWKFKSVKSILKFGLPSGILFYGPR